MTEPLRVLHLYAGNLYGGVERVLVELAGPVAHGEGLASRFALAFEGRLARELRVRAAPPELLGAVRLSRPWTVWSARRRLRRVLDAVAPEVVICHSTWAHAAFAPTVRTAGAHLVFWLHDALATVTAVDRLARGTPPDALLASSGYAAATAARLWPHLRPGVVYPPVTVPVPDGATDRGAVRAALGTPEDAVVLLLASRMEPWKGHVVLLDALALLPDEPDWRCWIAGGAQRPAERRHAARIRERADRLGIGERVRFLGERTDLASVMSAADLFCQPNLRPEPFGMVFVEAMHARLPVVGTRSGGTPEVVDTTCGVLVAPNDPAALAASLGELIREPGLRAALGAAGPARAAHLSDPARQARRLRAALDASLRGASG